MISKRKLWDAHLELKQKKQQGESGVTPNKPGRNQRDATGGGGKGQRVRGEEGKTREKTFWLWRGQITKV